MTSLSRALRTSEQEYHSRYGKGQCDGNRKTRRIGDPAVTLWNPWLQEAFGPVTNAVEQIRGADVDQITDRLKTCGEASDLHLGNITTSEL
jgi:hypothetical protein